MRLFKDNKADFIQETVPRGVGSSATGFCSGGERLPSALYLHSARTVRKSRDL